MGLLVLSDGAHCAFEVLGWGNEFSCVFGDFDLRCGARSLGVAGGVCSLGLEQRSGPLSKPPEAALGEGSGATISRMSLKVLVSLPPASVANAALPGSSLVGAAGQVSDASSASHFPSSWLPAFILHDLRFADFLVFFFFSACLAFAELVLGISMLPSIYFTISSMSVLSPEVETYSFDFGVF